MKKIIAIFKRWFKVRKPTDAEVRIYMQQKADGTYKDALELKYGTRI